MNSLEFFGSEPASNSLLVGINSLFWIAGNPSLLPRKRSENSASITPGPLNFGELPCIFPAYQGSAPKDPFAPDSPDRH
jgi:hypothetical protein